MNRARGAIIGGVVVATIAAGAYVAGCEPTGCGFDDTTAIQAQLDSTPNGSTVNVNGCISGPVTLHNKKDVEVVGYLRRDEFITNRNASYLIVDGSQNITVDNLKVNGDKPGEPNNVGYDPRYEGQHGIVVSGSSDVVLSNVSVESVRGDGIYVSGGNTVRIENSHVTETGRHNIGIVAGKDIEINGNVLTAAHRWTQDYEPNGLAFYVDNVWVHDNEFVGPTMGYVSGVGPHNNGTTCDANPTDPPPPEAGDCHFNVTNVLFENNVYR